MSASLISNFRSLFESPRDCTATKYQHRALDFSRPCDLEQTEDIQSEKIIQSIFRPRRNRWTLQAYVFLSRLANSPDDVFWYRLQRMIPLSLQLFQSPQLQSKQLCSSRNLNYPLSPESSFAAL